MLYKDDSLRQRCLAMTHPLMKGNHRRMYIVVYNQIHDGSEETRNPTVLCKLLLLLPCHLSSHNFKEQTNISFIVFWFSYFEQAHCSGGWALSPEEQEHEFPHLQLSL